MKKIVIICCLFACLPFFQASAQKAGKKILITGTVVDNENNPMPNAMLMVDGNKTNVMTDAEGHYKIKVKPYARTVGVVSLGSGVMEEEIADRTEINFYFKTKKLESSDEVTASDQPKENMVNTGYNDVEKSKLTTQVGKVKSTRSPKTYSTIYEMLQTVPGVRVTGRTVVVQGSQDFQGPVEPLFVVDGVPVTSIDDITPNTVESIEVLKGTAAAIYGTRGYGGVILIKRKSL
jgi:TonB-dependent SusC/RagA subfamily outer membrane receptor